MKSSFVMRGFDPRIYVFIEGVDGRVEPGHDAREKQ